MSWFLLPAAAPQMAWTVATGALTLVVGASTHWYAYQTRRREERDRLHRMADQACAITESRYVRPLLRRRLERALGGGDETQSGSLVNRARLFCRLEHEVCLSHEEKRNALDLAITALVDDLRSAPAPPLRVDTDAAVSLHHALLAGVVESAYHLRPRPSAQLIDRLGDFCRHQA